MNGSSLKVHAIWESPADPMVR